MAKRSRPPRKSQHGRDSSSKNGRDYEVGYGRPPLHSRFQPGQSGNPKGRPKERPNLRSVIEKALSEKIEIREGNRTRWVSKLGGVAVNLTNRAVKTDAKALTALIALLRLSRIAAESEPIMTEPVTAHDDEILADFLRRQRASIENADGPASIENPLNSDKEGENHEGRGGNIVIIDDPMKAQDTFSQSARESVREWFSHTLLSRLDNKSEDSIVLVMQRLHVDDLAGHLLDQGGWTHLNLPTIAESEHDIPIGPGRVHRRKPGDLLHADRESQSVIDEAKSAMGSLAFAAPVTEAAIWSSGRGFASTMRRLGDWWAMKSL